LENKNFHLEKSLRFCFEKNSHYLNIAYKITSKSEYVRFSISIMYNSILISKLSSATVGFLVRNIIGVSLRVTEKRLLDQGRVIISDIVTKLPKKKRLVSEKSYKKKGNVSRCMGFDFILIGPIRV